MTIILNGEKREFPGINHYTVTELIAALELGPQPVLVELNGEALYERDFPLKTVTEGNQVEIIRMVAGG
ncbi:MAG: sulfur carrier protein ThiS [Verrucomicrobiales bacterium]|nr:sulfur carrier protein ThiS [Verrucomicrobiales bacterium]